jgi:hypothetical protein
MFIQKKLPRAHLNGEPLLHQNHKRPVTRRDFLAAGLLPTSATLIAPAWLAALLKSRQANATLACDIAALAGQTLPACPTPPAGQCGTASPGSGMVPFIVFDLAGGANLAGSEVIVGTQGGQSNFLSTAGYGLLGLPGSLVPSANPSLVSSALGLLWHSDGAIFRGIMSKATTPATAANTNGAVICALAQNDTSSNPLNPSYGIAAVQLAGPPQIARAGSLLNLIGTQSSVSGGNSMAPAYMVQTSLQPAVIQRPADATALVNTGGASADPVAVATIESQARITGGTGLYNSTTQDPSVFSGVLTASNLQLYTAGVGSQTAAQADAQLKNQVRCSYVGAAYTADVFGNPGVLDPTQDTNIVGGATPIFTASDFSNRDVAATATIMKLVINGFAAAGTITMSGYDYHDGTRATGETRNFTAGQMIGAVLEYAQRVGKPVMIYVLTDGSLSSNSMIDNSAAGRGKLSWQGDNESTASTFFLVYSPKGRPQPRNGAASQQIGYFSMGGAVVTTSSPAANSVVAIAETVILNYMGLHGKDGNFSTLFSHQSLGSPAVQQAMTVFAPIV